MVVNTACSTASNVTMFWLALDRRTAVHNPLLYPLLVTSSTVGRQLLQTLGFIALLIGFATVILCIDVLLVARRTLRPNVAALPHELAERARLRKHVRTFYYLLRVMVLYGVCLIPFCITALLKAVLDIKASLARARLGVLDFHALLGGVFEHPPF
ncbi:hypothetical protein FJT64_026592 [Amphibalanus amphitrite]|uniref:Uncharacterized protein n=1 Tax=Amphibalanus amphitrite TaxID=1232801 RepID=A0A6A4WB28_AMPAM|nr:hypothetical protein FJT64_026592 [Amphibalanus amphitrite]